MTVLRFSTELKSPISALIRWRTDWHHSHVEYQLDSGWTVGSRFSLQGKIARFVQKRFGHTIKSRINLDGVQLRPPSANKNQCVDPRSKYCVSFATFTNIEQCCEWVQKNRIGFKYDLLAIFGIVTGRNWHCKDGRFCSDVISESGEPFNTYFQNRYETAPYELAPRDLEISTAIVEIGESQSIVK